MKILMTGASGFLGSHILDRLLADGHTVRAVVRDPQRAAARRGRAAAASLEWMRLDFAQALTPDDWLPALRDMDAVVNAVGILREQGGQTFDLLHRQAPCALFAACAASGVKRVLQISALGADAAACSRYHLSKRAADDFLLSLPLQATVLQPSLVYGEEGASARLFGTLASLPLVPLPGGGRQRVQPVHVDDVAEAVRRLLEGVPAPARLEVVGPRPLGLRDYLAILRRALGNSRRLRVLAVPAPLARRGASLASVWPALPVDGETLAMLERGNTGDAATFTRVLGRPPRPPEEFVPPALARPLGMAARLGWLLPALRTSIGAVWIFTGIVSLGVYPVASSLALLARSGVSPRLQLIALYGAAVLDLVLGLLTFIRRRRRLVWALQAALILGYTAILSLKLPEFWLHPYGPLSKNLPMLAAIWLLYEMEEKAWTTRR